MEYEPIGLTDGISGRLLIQLNNQSIIKKYIPVINEKLDYVETLDFYNGLLGIFWVLSIIQRITKLTDSLLSKQKRFDDFVYKSIVNYIPTDLSVNKGIIGKGVYFCQILRCESETNYYRRTLIREALVLCAQEVNRFISKKYTNTTLDQNNIYELAQAACFMISLKRIDMNPVVIDKPLCNIIELINESLLHAPATQPVSNLLNYLSFQISDKHFKRLVHGHNYNLECYNLQRNHLIGSLMKMDMDFWPLL